jgi:hypothetical protein
MKIEVTRVEKFSAGSAAIAFGAMAIGALAFGRLVIRHMKLEVTGRT